MHERKVAGSWIDYYEGARQTCDPDGYLEGASAAALVAALATAKLMMPGLLRMQAFPESSRPNTRSCSIMQSWSVSWSSKSRWSRINSLRFRGYDDSRALRSPNQLFGTVASDITNLRQIVNTGEALSYTMSNYG